MRSLVAFSNRVGQRRTNETLHHATESDKRLLQYLPAHFANPLLVPVHLASSLGSSNLAHDVYLVCNISEDTQNPLIALHEVICLVFQTLLCSPLLYVGGSLTQVMTGYPGEKLWLLSVMEQAKLDGAAHMMCDLHIEPAMHPLHVFWTCDVHGRAELPRRETFVYAQIFGRLRKVRQGDLDMQRARDHEAHYEEAQTRCEIRDAAKDAASEPQPEEGYTRQL